MPCGSPRAPERWIDTPGRRCSDAATFESGNLPISSEEIASTTPAALRLMSRLRCSEPRMPVTTIVSRSEEHTSELQSLMRISYAVFCLKKKKKNDVEIPQLTSTP